ncbi:MAG: hypothetical protein ACRDKB_05845 [Actinomycetota bacterium]
MKKFESRRRTVAVLLILALSALETGALLPARSQTPAECFDPNDPTPEAFGPTDISAVTGNQRLSVGLNPDATVTVLKWPSPSFYDQIKYRTTDRSRRRFGALPNEGAFLGLGFKQGDEPWKLNWLRRWRSRQRYVDADRDQILTVFTRRRLGLTVKVTDLVAHDSDALVRKVVVKRSRRSKVDKVRVVSFVNFNPVFSKSAQAPVQDWCFEEQNDDGAQYAPKADAIVASRSGTDDSTGAPSSVSLAMGFRGPSHQHHVGPDTYEAPSTGTSAYDDAADARLAGSDSQSGQSDGALSDQLGLKSRRKKSTTVFVTAGKTAKAARRKLADVRERSNRAVRRAKAAWWRRWLRSVPLPKDAPKAVTRLSKRALVSLRQVIDKDTRDAFPEGAGVPRGGLIMASIATQSPYGVDWIRDGAYLNRALDIAGHHRTVAQHNYRYALLQTRASDGTRGGQPIPPGNWHMNFYADGVVGGPIPYEIDETGYGIWTLWDHYAQTKDINYLLVDHGGIVYRAIELAAQYLTDVCKDLTNNLQCVANEDDNPDPRQTVYGALLVWLGLDSAAKAARVRGGDAALANAQRWEARRDELAAAIEASFFDEECTCYTRTSRPGAHSCGRSGISTTEPRRPTRRPRSTTTASRRPSPARTAGDNTKPRPCSGTRMRGRGGGRRSRS